MQDGGFGQLPLPAKPRAKGDLNVQLDAQSVLFASQAISREMQLDKALTILLNILISTAGMCVRLSPVLY